MSQSVRHEKNTVDAVRHRHQYNRSTFYWRRRTVCVQQQLYDVVLLSFVSWNFRIDDIVARIVTFHRSISELKRRFIKQLFVFATRAIIVWSCSWKPCENSYLHTLLLFQAREAPVAIDWNDAVLMRLMIEIRATHEAFTNDYTVRAVKLLYNWSSDTPVWFIRFWRYLQCACAHPFVSIERQFGVSVNMPCWL